MGKINQLVKAAETLLGNKALMLQDVKEMSTEDLVATLLVLDGLLKDKGALNLRLAEVKERLKSIVEKDGTIPDKKKGHKALKVGDVLLVNQRRPASKPDEAGLKALVEKTKGVEMKDVTTITKSVAIDMSKVKALVSLGKLDEKKINKLKKVTIAFTMEAMEQTKHLLEDAGLTPIKKK